MSDLKSYSFYRMDLLRDYFTYWMTWQKKGRDSEGLSTDDGTAVMCVPPHWPYRASLQHWIETLTMASDENERLRAALSDLVETLDRGDDIGPGNIERARAALNQRFEVGKYVMVAGGDIMSDGSFREIDVSQQITKSPEA